VNVDLAARARIAILDELDPQTVEAARSCLSPYLGFVGAVSGDTDPRSNERLWVTAVERMAICPWQTFLERLLRIEAVPDPLEALPRINGLLIGLLVHRVLERVVFMARGETSFESLRTSAAASVDWPSPSELDRWLDEEALTTVRTAGISLTGFARALTAVARPYLEIARQLDWAGGRLDGVVAAEIEGGVDFEAEDLRRRRIAFRADRVDRQAGNLTLVDYKTGRPLLDQKTPDGRRRAILRAVESGRGLQAVVYALAAGQTGDEGRFTFLTPKVDSAEEARWVTVGSDDETIRRAFEESVSTVLRAFDKGLFFPRLEVPSRPHEPAPACSWCTVAEACLKQDSAARRRLREGIPALVVPSEAIDRQTADALLDHWWLGSAASRPASDPGNEETEA